MEVNVGLVVDPRTTDGEKLKEYTFVASDHDKSRKSVFALGRMYTIFFPFGSVDKPHSTHHLLGNHIRRFATQAS